MMLADPVRGAHRADIAGPDGSRAAILRAAATCFTERGYAATSIDDVARSLGATKGRIYHHYPSKADLFADVFRAGMDMNFAAIAPVRDLDLPPLEKWTRLATIHTRQMIATKAFQRAVWEGVELHLRGATTPEQREAFARLVDSRSDYENVFRETIVAGRAEGVFRFDNASIALQVMFTALNSPIFWYSPRQDETDGDIDSIARQVVTFASRGLGARED